jgi:hypothetical protein
MMVMVNNAKPSLTFISKLCSKATLREGNNNNFSFNHKYASTETTIPSLYGQHLLLLLLKTKPYWLLPSVQQLAAVTGGWLLTFKSKLKTHLLKTAAYSLLDSSRTYDLFM